MEEIWKEVPDYEGLFWVSNKERIKAAEKYVPSRYGCQRLYPARIFTGTQMPQGYMVTSLTKDGVKKRIYFHRIVAAAFVPNPENKPFVNHINGIKNDNRPENLEWCTAKENVKHAFDTNLRSTLNGEDLNSKLKEDQVRKIIAIGRKLPLGVVGKTFNVSVSVVSEILNAKAWKHITREEMPYLGDSNGENSANAKLKNEDVLEIRRLAAGGEKHTQIAKKYNIGSNAVNRIVNRKTWKHI